MLGKVLRETSTNENLFVCGDMNGYLSKDQMDIMLCMVVMVLAVKT